MRVVVGLLALSSLTVSTLLSTPVAAHIGGAEGLVPFLDDDGELIGAGTTWGLVFPDDSGAFKQSCEETIGDIPTAFVRVDGGARTIVSMGLGVAATTDLGCTYAVVPGSEGRRITAMVPSSVTPRALWAISATTEASGGIDNDLLRSDDDGASFVSARSFPTSQLLTKLTVEPLAADSELVFFSGTGLNDDGVREPRLLQAVSTAGVVDTVTTLPVPAEGLLVSALTIDDDGAWFSTLDLIGRGHLWRAPLLGEGADSVVIDSANAVDVGSFDAIVSATEVHAGFRFVLASGGVMWRAPVDDAGSTTTSLTWERVRQLPLRCLLHVDGDDDGLWACGAEPTGAWFLRSVDGETWSPVLPFVDVADHLCPSGTPAAAACAYRFEVPTPPVDEPTTPLPPPSTPTSSSSSCGEGSAALLLCAGLLRRRRR